jgi:hypothetical protein
VSTTSSTTSDDKPGKRPGCRRVRADLEDLLDRLDRLIAE